MKTAKKKGNSFESQVAKILSSWYYNDVNVLVRNANSGSMAKFRSYEVPPGDILQVKTMALPFPYSVECKHHKEFSIEKLLFGSTKTTEHKAWIQCLEDAGAVKKIPLLVFKRNYGGIYMCVMNETLDDLLDDPQNFLTFANYCLTRSKCIIELESFLSWFPGYEKRTSLQGDTTYCGLGSELSATCD